MKEIRPPGPFPPELMLACLVVAGFIATLFYGIVWKQLWCGLIPWGEASNVETLALLCGPWGTRSGVIVSACRTACPNRRYWERL